MIYRLSFLLLLTLPFQFALPLWGAWDIPLSRLIAILLILTFAGAVLFRRSWFLPSPGFTGASLSFLGIAAVSWLWAAHSELTLPRIAFLLNLLPLIFVWYDFSQRNADQFERLVQAFLWGAGISAFVAVGIFLSQFFFGVSDTFHFLVDRVLPIFLGRELGALVANYPSLLVNIDGATLLRATAVFPDPHVAAYFFGMSGFLALGFFRATDEKRYAWLAGGIFLADILTFSRGGYIGLLLAGMMYGAIVIPVFAHKQKMRLVTVLVIGMIALVLFGQPVLSRFLTSFSLADTSSVERIALWKEALPAIGEHPVLGAGLGNYLSTARPLYVLGTPFYAHNLYLDIALEVGLIGLIAFLGMFLVAFVRAAQSVRSDPWSAALLAALTLYLAHSIFETALFSLHATIALALLLVLALRASVRVA